MALLSAHRLLTSPTREAAMAAFAGGQFNCRATLAVVFLTQIKIFAAVFSVIAKRC
jgi:hypothetical protein